MPTSLRLSSLRRKLLFAGLSDHPGRTLLSMAAIALGVALGLAVQLINQSAVAEFGQALLTFSGNADLTLRGPRAGFDETLYPVVARLPEVAVASPAVELELRVAGRPREDRELLRVTGLDLFRAAHIQPALVFSEGAQALDFLRPDRIFLSLSAAAWLGVEKGGTVRLETLTGEAAFEVAGLLRDDELRQRIAVIDIAAAQDRFGRVGRLSRIDIRLRPGADATAFTAAASGWLPAGLALERPAESFERAANLSRAYRVNLNVLALVALFTGGLLVFTTQALSVVRRRAQFALLRVLGMTRGQVLRRVLVESAVIGFAGAIAGLLLGVAGAAFVLKRVGADLGAGQFRGLEPALRVEIWALLLFLVLGVITAVGGSLAAAREAAMAPPSRALRAGDEARAFERLSARWPGLLLIALGTLLTFAPPVADLPLPGYTAIALMLMGTILLMPAIAAAVFRRLPSPRAAPLRLALAQLAGSPGQASVSLAAIVASVSLMVSMAVMIGSFRISLDEWLDRVLPADLYMRTGPGNDSAVIDPAMQARLARLPGVRTVQFMKVERISLAPSRPPVALIARDIDSATPERGVPLMGNARAPLAGDEPPAWVSEAVSDLYGYRVGDTVELPVGERRARFTVSGIWRDYARQHGAIVIERSEYLKLTGDRTANEASIWLASGVDAAGVRETIAALPMGSKLDIASPGEIRATSLRIFDRTFAVTYGLEAAAVALGLVGLSASFGALVLSRRREFGVLRHLGFTRGQVGAMLAAEGALVSGLGLAVGCALGWLIALVLIHVVNRQSFHWSMELHLPWGQLSVFVTVLFALAMLTALLSGRQAMSGDSVRAVKEDW